MYFESKTINGHVFKKWSRPLTDKDNPSGPPRYLYTIDGRPVTYTEFKRLRTEALEAEHHARNADLRSVEQG